MTAPIMAWPWHGLAFRSRIRSHRWLRSAASRSSGETRHSVLTNSSAWAVPRISVEATPLPRSDHPSVNHGAMANLWRAAGTLAPFRCFAAAARRRTWRRQPLFCHGEVEPHDRWRRIGDTCGQAELGKRHEALALDPHLLLGFAHDISPIIWQLKKGSPLSIHT